MSTVRGAKKFEALNQWATQTAWPIFFAALFVAGGFPVAHIGLSASASASASANH